MKPHAHSVGGAQQRRRPGAADLGAASSFSYYAGSSASGSPLAGAPSNAGTYTVVAHFGGNGNYAEHELEAWARLIEGWRDRGDVYAYFNNDWEGYALDNGLWMKRRMRVGETLVSSANRIQWYDRSCRPVRSTRYSFQTTLEAHRRDFEAGGDLGRQDAIVLRYADPGGAEVTQS